MSLRKVFSFITLVSFGASAATPATGAETDPFADAPPAAVRKSTRKPIKKTPKSDAILSDIPQVPSIPPVLNLQQPREYFRCERDFIYQGERIPCDSTIRQDGERLRPIIKDVPEAVAELDQYQRNRRTIRSAAYVGSAALVLMIAGVLWTRRFTHSSGKLTEKGQFYRDLSSYTGFALIGGTVIFGISALQSNETRLGNAVRYYNEKNPNRPIELQFTTEFNL